MAKKTKQARLSKAEMRVTIAKDALAQLRAAKFIATSGVYIDYDLKSRLFDLDKDLPAQEILKKETKSCDVCAKGAIFLSAVRKFNKATIGDVACDHFGVAEAIFGAPQFDLIESAFEQSIDYAEGNNPAKDVYRAVAFGYEYSNDNDRLVAILKNIIKNNGTFKP